jgi:cytochrome c oxidase cbb3-type subunit 2
VTVVLPSARRQTGRCGYAKVIATPRRNDLVAYLISLKQAPLPTGVSRGKFLHCHPRCRWQTCGPCSSRCRRSRSGRQQSIHQCLRGLPPAGCQRDPRCVPGLGRGADLVNEKDPLKMVDIVLGGYEGLPQYGPMPSQAHLSDEEIAAVINYVRSNFGNDAPPTDAATVKTQRAVLAPETVQQ